MIQVAISLRFLGLKKIHRKFQVIDGETEAHARTEKQERHGDRSENTEDELQDRELPVFPAADSQSRPEPLGYK